MLLSRRVKRGAQENEAEENDDKKGKSEER